MAGLQKCPNCEFLLAERPTHCPYCGQQLTHSPMIKLGAWVLLIFVVYGLIQCNLRIMEGLDDFWVFQEQNEQGQNLRPQ
ncbi:MAG TPA: hypothetical protein VMN76_11515 [Acidobacteriota bacterium]|nr:hypothetical protein [Acidobacteriota bacterium]